MPKSAPDSTSEAACCQPGQQTASVQAAAPGVRKADSSYRSWALLLRKAFGIELELCPSCGGRMRLLALVTDPKSVARFLRHIGEPAEPPARAPARDPPFWHSRVLRRRHEQHDEPNAQLRLFEEH